MLLGNITWLLVLFVICFFIAKAAVHYFIKSYPSERTYKFIPAIASFIIFIYCAAIGYFQVDVFIRNILFLLLGVLLMAMSFLCCIFSLIIAAIHEYKNLKKQAVKGEE